MAPRSVVVVFGGLGMSRRALQRYADVYEPRRAIVVPLTLTCLAAGGRYTGYRALHEALAAQAGGAPLHVHGLSAHLRSLRDAPETYAGFCRAVADEA